MKTQAVTLCIQNAFEFGYERDGAVIKNVRSSNFSSWSLSFNDNRNSKFPCVILSNLIALGGVVSVRAVIIK